MPTEPAERAVFLRRPNRFVIECLLSGRKVRAYLPNPGRLWELLLPGSVVHLHSEPGPNRKLGYTALAVEKDGAPVPLHTIRANAVFRELLEAGRLPGLEGCTVRRAEVSFGRSRFDFLLERGGQELLIEVKSCTLFGHRLAMFPDAVTERGRRHLEELAGLRRRGRRCGVVFLVHKGGAEFFLPEYHTDPEFARTLYALRDELIVRPYAIGWSRALRPTRVSGMRVPWGLLRREMADRGAYILVLHVGRDRRLRVDGLGSVLFRRGYHLYVGSAVRGLEARLARYRRRRTGRGGRRHIDCLRGAADSVKALAVRGPAGLECAMADAIGEISEGRTEGFGATRCPCGGHLFYMKGNPVHDPAFIEVLVRFRINRLEDSLPERSPED